MARPQQHRRPIETEGKVGHEDIVNLGTKYTPPTYPAIIRIDKYFVGVVDLAGESEPGRRGWMYGLEVPFGTLPPQWFFVLRGHDPGEFARPVSCRLFGLRGRGN